MVLHLCPKCGKDTFEIYRYVCFGSDPHHEGMCKNPNCDARGRLDILQLQAELKTLKQLILNQKCGCKEDKIVMEKINDVLEKERRNDKTNQDGNGRRGKHKL